MKKRPIGKSMPIAASKGRTSRPAPTPSPSPNSRGGEPLSTCSSSPLPSVSGRVGIKRFRGVRPFDAARGMLFPVGEKSRKAPARPWRNSRFYFHFMQIKLASLQERQSGTPLSQKKRPLACGGAFFVAEFCRTLG